MKIQFFSAVTVVPKIFAAMLLVATSPTVLPAEDGATDVADDLFSKSLEEVLDIPVAVAAKGKKQTAREAPGTVTVLDSDYITSSGARDLGELLQTVPGFQFTTDVEGGSLMGFRGLYNVGRILLRVDGQEINERVFSTVQAQNRFPTGIIERVEIIRGPGSVLYGGSAEYAVIEVTTKRPKGENDGSATFNTGVNSDGLARRVGTVWQSIGNDQEFLSVGLSTGRSVRGSNDYTDFFGNSYSVEGSADQYPRNLNIGGKYDDFSFRYIIDRYHFDQRDQYYFASPYSVPVEFNQDRFEIKYAPKLTDELGLDVSYSYGYDQTWKTNDPGAVELQQAAPDLYPIYFNQHLRRNSGELNLNYQALKSLSLLVGSSITDDQGRGFLIDGSRAENFDTQATAVYGEASYKPDFATFTAGTRYEDDDNYGSALVSRLAISKAESDWHAKFQVAQSFRAPGFQYTAKEFEPGNPDYRIQPEETTVEELELGHAVGSDVYLTGVLFNIHTKDSINYFYDPENGDSYGNTGDTGSKGVELNLRYVTPRGNVNLSYAFYRADSDVLDSKPKRADGTVIDDHQFIGYSPHMVTLSGDLKLDSQFSLNTIFVFHGPRYASRGMTEEFVPYDEKVSSEFLWNETLTARNVGWDNLDLQLGVYNILDTGTRYTSNTTFLHPPMPGLGRELFLNATLRW